MASGIVGAVGTAVSPAIVASRAGPHDGPLDPSVVRSIQNGDERSEVESKLGPADEVGMTTENGLCCVKYTRNNQKVNSLAFIPIVQFFAKNRHEFRSQTLSITYKDDVVQKREFTDYTRVTSGGHTTQRPSPGAEPPKPHTEPATTDMRPK